MTEVGREALVLITDQDRRPEVIDELRRSATVVQLLPPRLATIALAVGQREVVPEIAGATFYVDEVPSEVVNSLLPQEQVFARGWQARRGGKNRSGDQLSWDTPGFTPPE